ncbi:MAG TPA: cobalamin-independent methionine synthase II family protein [Bryobacteraceae bacterium]|nr:cobalamin-independent methionine synthase II family protein [Bryobacteraceae bacterium]
MRRSQNRILTTHVGSLVRPPEIRDLAAAAEKDPAVRETYEHALANAIAGAVRRQVDAGIDIINDGEYAKSGWSSYVLGRISGFEIRPEQLRPLIWLGRDRERFAEFIAKDMPRVLTGAPTEACVGPIAYRDTRPIQTNIAMLQSALAEAKVEEGFLTAVAPASTAYDGVNEYYRTDKEYVYAIAEALREEYLAIYRSGLLLQVDDAVLANMYDHLVQSGPEKYRQWAELRVEALNHALAGIPEDRIRYHVCFGSWHVPHLADAPLDALIGLILKVRAGAYSIEAANPRHEHEWRVWETAKLPDGKILIPGVVTHHTVTVEHPRLVADRIIRYARIVGRENVIAGTDCGFAQMAFIQRVPESVMWEKLKALVEGAKIASRELW